MINDRAAHFADTYYSNTVPLRKSHLTLRGNRQADICVIGGGYAGLMTQLGILQRGSDSVILLENNTIGSGASGRNGGFVFAGYSLAPEKIYRQVGCNHARELYQLTEDAVELIRQRVSLYDIECELVESGVIWANWFKDQRVLYEKQNFMQQRFGVNWTYLNPTSLYQKIKSRRYCGGLFEPSAMHFHPLKYTLGIAEQVCRLGGRILENTTVRSIVSGGRYIKVVTDEGSISCKHVVVCAGGYIDHLIPPVSRAILPIASYIMVTEPLPKNCADHLFTQAAVYDNRFAFDYFRPLRDGRLLWGGRISTHKSRDVKTTLHRDLIKVFPSLENVAIDYAWDGWMAYARHQMPCIGKLTKGIWYNIGYGGHGVGPSTVGGELIASAIVDGDDRYRLFDPWGLAWSGGAGGRVIAQVSYWGYQCRDWAKQILGR